MALENNGSMAKEETINQYMLRRFEEGRETERELQIPVSSIVEKRIPIPLHSAGMAVNLNFNILVSPDPKIPAENNNFPAISSRPGRAFNHEYGILSAPIRGADMP